jgi:tRNA-specific 2-thiouridylase
LWAVPEAIRRDYPGDLYLACKSADDAWLNIRAEAEARGLTVAQKPDSHDICFIPDGDTRGWLGEHLHREPGPILDRSGAVVGQHDGAGGYTVGQRRGLHLGTPAPDGRPRFVLEVRPVSNTVVVGSREEVAVAVLAGDHPSWTGAPPEPGPLRCHVQVRAHAEPVPAVLHRDGDRAEVRLNAPLGAVAPGQSAVIYVGTQVIGQFTVARTEPAAGPVPVGVAGCS